jgi:hypothetical protein
MENGRIASNLSPTEQMSTKVRSVCPKSLPSTLPSVGRFLKKAAVHIGPPLFFLPVVPLSTTTIGNRAGPSMKCKPTTLISSREAQIAAKLFESLYSDQYPPKVQRDLKAWVRRLSKAEKLKRRGYGVAVPCRPGVSS